MRRRAPEPDRGFNPAGEPGWRRLRRQPLSDQTPQCLDARVLRGERWLASEAALDLQRMRRIELAVHISMDEQARIVLVCRGGHGSSVPNAAIRRRRARASRDITVPI